MIPIAVVVEAVKEWRVLRPFHTWKLAREAKKAAASQVDSGLTDGPPVATGAESPGPRDLKADVNDTGEDGGMFSELAKSMARSALKVVGAGMVTYAVTHGVVDMQSASDLGVALETLGGAVLTIGGLIWSHRTHKA